MRIDASVLLDLFSSLALVALLILLFGPLRRRILGADLAPIALGLLFGCAATLQMLSANGPISGVIVDLRAVPIVLAGAFLGRRGLAACLGVALVARYQIGGIGMISDLAAMLLAGLVGLVWDRLTRRAGPRDKLHFLMLGAALSLSLSAAILLPPQFTSWFYTSAAVPLAALYLISVPLLAALFERERLFLACERAMLAGMRPDPKAGRLDSAAFYRHLADHTSTGAEPAAGLLVLTLRQPGQVSRYWQKAVLGHVLTGLQPRFMELLRSGDTIGLTPDGRVLLALTAAELPSADRLLIKIRQIVEKHAMSLPDGDAICLNVRDRLVLVRADMTAAELEDAVIDAETPARQPVQRPILPTPGFDRPTAPRPLRATGPTQPFRHKRPDTLGRQRS